MVNICSCPAGGLFPLVIAVILIIFVRDVYLITGKYTALLMSIIFLLIPLVLYAFYYTLTSSSIASYIIGKFLTWILILVAILLGIGIFYTVTKTGIAIVSPETSNKIELSLILRDAKTHFSFMLEKGYKISHLEYISHPLAGWHFQLDSPDDKVSIVLDQQERPSLIFGKEKTNKQHKVFLEAMIYYLTDRKVFIGNNYNSFYATPSRSEQLQKIAKLLKAYINQIEVYLHEDFEKGKNELSSIQEQYVNLLIQESEQRRKNQK